MNPHEVWESLGWSKGTSGLQVRIFKSPNGYSWQLYVGCHKKPQSQLLISESDRNVSSYATANREAEAAVKRARKRYEYQDFFEER